VLLGHIGYGGVEAPKDNPLALDDKEYAVSSR
jgi:hypothetical protein